MNSKPTFIRQKLAPPRIEARLLQNLIEASQENKSNDLDRLLELSLDLICIAGTDGYFKRISKSFERVLGYSEEEMLSVPFSTFVVTQDQYKTEEALDDLKLGYPNYHFENRYRCKDGKIKWLAWRSVSVPDDNLIYAIARDVTHQKRIEEELRLYTRELKKFREENLQSLQYARSIQKALMPRAASITEIFPESFIYQDPKSIVSGDFFWFQHLGEKTFVSVADCTGHGVPGGLLTVIGINDLQSILQTGKIKSPARILSELDSRICLQLSKKFGRKTIHDGMDVVACTIDMDKMTLSYSAANQNIYLVRNGKITVIKGDRISLGSQFGEQVFKQHQLRLQEGDMLYLLTDGLGDQFGGPLNKKYGLRKLRSLLVNLEKHPVLNQEKILQDELVRWRRENERTDDVLVMGIRIRQ